jgi:TonB family protein
MWAHRSKRCAVGRAILVLVWLRLVQCNQSIAQQLPAATPQPHAQIAALAEKLGAQLLAGNEKRPFILDLTLPDDVPCPLGAWLADKLSESLAQSHPELEVIPRGRWSIASANAESAHDINHALLLKEQRAQSLGAEILVQGNFAAIPGGIGVTLIASDRLAGGASRFEALAEIPLTTEMQSTLTTSLPQRPMQEGVFKASQAGIGSPQCEFCPPPQYTYVARAKKLQGVVIARVLVAPDGAASNITIVRSPHPLLADAALRTVRTWRFQPARNFQGDSVPVLVDVAVSFRLGAAPSPAASTDSATAISKKF